MQLCAPVRSTVEDIISAIEEIPDSPYFIHLPYDLVVGRPSQFYVGKVTSFIQELSAEVRSDTKMVIHFGSTAKGGSLSNVIKLCQGIDDLEHRQLLLENMAGSKNIMGSSIEDLKSVYSQVPTGVGFCLDSQHSFATSMIDWRDISNVKKSLDQISDITGGIDLVHFNDSKVEYGSRKDSHQRLGRGNIWVDNHINLIKVVRELHDRKITMIPETRDSVADAEYIGRVINKYEIRKSKRKC